MRATRSLTALAAAVLLAGCASGDDVARTSARAPERVASPDVATRAEAPSEPDEPDAAALAAAAESVRGRSTRSRFTISSTTPEGDLGASGEAVRDADGATSRITVVLRGELAARLGLGAGEVEIEVRTVDDVTYQRVPALLPELPSGVEWITYEASQLPGPVRRITEHVAAADPSATLDALAGARDVVAVGREDVRGTVATRYEAVVDMALVEDGAAVDDAPRRDVPVTVWVGDGGRVRRVATEVAADGVRARTTVDVLGYDVTVDVAAPPADAVRDLGVLVP